MVETLTADVGLHTEFSDFYSVFELDLIFFNVGYLHCKKKKNEFTGYEFFYLLFL